MADLPTLRRELIGAFAIVFAGALFVAMAGILIVVPRLAPGSAALYVVSLLLVDVALFAWFGALLLRRRLLRPLEGLVAGVEAVSQGSFDTRLPESKTQELARLSAAVNQMGARLIEDQQKLAENIRSLNETNRLLTEARDAMIRTEKMASVGRLGAGIAHEVGNPLGAILGYLGLLKRQQQGETLELLQAAEREASRIDRIIRGLLDYARPRDAASVTIDVHQVVLDTIDLVRTQGRFGHVTVDYEPSPDASLAVRGDPYQLQQVLVNLLVNAADAAEDAADARISVMTVCRIAEPDAPHLPARRKGDPEGIDYSHRRRLAMMQRWPTGDPDSSSGFVADILVADNGPGLPADMIDQIFEPFVTTKEPGKGTGLGLAVCARLVEGMGGAVRAHNAESGGAVFRVILPAVMAEVVAT